MLIRKFTAFILTIFVPFLLTSLEEDFFATPSNGILQEIDSQQEDSSHKWSIGSSFGFLYNFSRLDIFKNIENIETFGASAQPAVSLHSMYKYAITPVYETGIEVLFLHPLSNGKIANNYLNQSSENICFVKKPIYGSNFLISANLNESSALIVGIGALATEVTLSSQYHTEINIISNLGNYFVAPMLSIKLNTIIKSANLSIDYLYGREYQRRERLFDSATEELTFLDPKNSSILWSITALTLTLSIPFN